MVQTMRYYMLTERKNASRCAVQEIISSVCRAANKKIFGREITVMTYKIGFLAEHKKSKAADAFGSKPAPAAPRRSLVSVYFPQRNLDLAYYNDKFDLHVGDTVYVDGKLEGMRGRVTAVNYCFKIKLSDYKRVIALVDTEVHGELFSADSHFVTLDPCALAREKVRLWYMSPEAPEDEYVSGSGEGERFSLAGLDGTNVSDIMKKTDLSPAAAERGHNYYAENRVRYFCVDHGRGYAIVEGSRPYEVEFEYGSDGSVGALTCSCYCTGGCKHEFAAMLQLSETLNCLSDIFPDAIGLPEYFAAIVKTDLFSFAVDGKRNGSFIL